MEIGTGKTYVYLRSLFELNRRYGFTTKFVVVVPSVANKEGVNKTLQITRLQIYGGCLHRIDEGCDPIIPMQVTDGRDSGRFNSMATFCATPALTRYC